MSAAPPAAPDRPLSDEEFAALMAVFAPFEPAPRLAVAVSGGADSMALVVLAQAWARARGGESLALVVDHRLRPESGREAERVLGWLERLGIRGRILCADRPPPASGLQAWARKLRYRLLEHACLELGALHLLLAHRQEDQVETVAMRKARGSGPLGLAGIPAERFTPSVRLVRPLLGVPRARILATLKARRVPWLEDPSNRDPRFARTPLRAHPPPERPLLACAAQAAAARSRLEAEAARWCASHARIDPFGWAELDLEAWHRADPELRLLLLSRLCLVVGGREHPPRRRVLARLLRELAGSAGKLRRTAGGCLLEVRGPRLRLFRELRGAKRARAEPVAGGLWWDGRWTIRLKDGPAVPWIGPLDSVPSARLRAALLARARGLGIPREALPGLPALSLEGGIWLSPLAPFRAARLGVRFSFRPCRRLLEAPFRALGSIASRPAQSNC